MADIPGDSTTTVSVAVGSTTKGLIEVGGDHDWFRIELTAGQTIRVLVNGVGVSALEDPYVRIRDASGNIIFENDDGGAGRNALVTFKANYSGVYFIDVAAWDEVPAQYNYTGEYELQVLNYQPPELATIDQIASQLTHGYWDGQSFRFAASEGGSISVDLTALTSAGQGLAREALRQWSDVIGVRFTEVSQGAQITFDDDEEGAHSSSIYSGATITSAHVNVSTAWLASFGTSFDSYSFQTYLHEIGHALGLGHAGNYDGEATFPYDALFLNDAWSTSVMSYFAPSENSHFSALGFSDSYIATPMLADIAAMANLYGLSTTTRLGNTTYGFNSNAGNIAYDATLYPAVAYTVFDSGGIDTLDYSGFASVQTIDLTPGAFSNIGGRNGNVAIAIGTVIENAIGGSSDDTLFGNSANNILNGGAGRDIVSYARASSGVTVDLGLSGAQNTIGAGSDTLIGFEILHGSDHDDRLTGGVGFTTVRGGAGNDTLMASADGDSLHGEAGDDLFIGGVGIAEYFGGLGFDTVDFSAASSGVNAGSGSGPTNHLSEIERLIGSSFDDHLGFAPIMIGGAGNDVYTGGSGNQIVEAAGQGVDTVRAFGSYTLPDNVENMSLHWDPYAGAAITPAPPMDGTGNAADNIIIGGTSANRLSGLAGSDTLTGGEGVDTLIGGAGNDTFRDTLQGLNGDTIVDFTVGDRLIFTDAQAGSFTFSLSGSTLTYSGGSLTFGAALSGGLSARALAGGAGVELTLSDTLFNVAQLKLADFGSGAEAGGWSSDTRYPRLMADVNGDGRADIVGFGEKGAYVSLGTSAATFTAATLATTSFGAGAAAGGWSSNDLHLRQLADVNGDGRDDIVGFGNHGVYVSLSGASGSFGATTLVTTAFGAAASAGGWSSNDRYLRLLADVNGDSKADIVGFGNDGVYVSLATQTGSFAAPTLATTAFGVAASAGGWSSNDRFLRQLADVNGDGMADIIGFGNDGVYVALARANGTFAAPTLSLLEFGAGAGAGGWSSDDRFPRELADVNGDNKIDIVGFGNGGVYIALGQGNGTFGASRPDLGFFGAQPGAGSWSSDDLYPRHLADVNNDGAADIVGFASNGVYVSTSSIDLLA